MSVVLHEINCMYTEYKYVCVDELFRSFLRLWAQRLDGAGHISMFFFFFFSSELQADAGEICLL